MKPIVHIIAFFVIGIALGLYLSPLFEKESFQDYNDSKCDNCGKEIPASRKCKKSNTRKHNSTLECPPVPDMSKYVLKSSIPPCPALPDMSNYILKSECPPVPDLSNYVLKSSIPRQSPVILDCSKCQKPKGECPPCPRARCPEVKCPNPTKCPTCAPCPRQSCPPAVVKCKTEEVKESENLVRPYLAPLSYRGFGMD